ncbi:cation:proton antiporter [Photobacterium atrarenae]|uniref:Sodium:proton antiporter n=1 Tax=Photobacterium atrarenae TaxID=865757 RepID=A0ABY5GJI5_9GAMM|nr:sodium:proton antiporter [Photobacterium atrarenae]UTV29483.1 sodium:proton antiporter [Photobacterium atrarenae]
MNSLSFVAIAFVVLSLVGLNALTYYSHRTRLLPDIVWVLLLGVLYGFLSTTTELGLPEITLNSELVLYAFVPLLIFSSTQKICLHHIRKVLLPASLIGSVGILISMVIIGAILHFVFGMPWLATLLFGVIISATDPLAIGALLHENKTLQESRKLLIEGESILNDGFVVTVFGVFMLLMFEGATFSPVNSSASLFSHITGALIIGVLLGRAARWLLAYWHGEHFSLRTNMTLALAFGSLLLAESLHFSGILAVFSAALAYGYKRPEPDQNTHIQGCLWDYFEYIANASLFFLLGASFSGLASFDLLTFSLVITSLILLIVARLVAILLLFPAITIEGEHLTPQEFWLLNFSGARGAVSIALILLLPDSFELKETFLSISFVMILFSLVLYPIFVQQLQRKPG